MRARIVPATPEMLRVYYGRAPSRTAEAVWAMVLNGEPICISGFYTDEHQRVVIFADAQPIVREKFAKTAMRMGYLILGEALQLGVPVYAAANHSIEAAPRFLEHFGFQHLEQGVYLCPALKP